MNRNEIRKNVGFSVLRRDFRQTHGEPEASKTTAKKRKVKGGKRIDHKHIWVEAPKRDAAWYKAWGFTPDHDPYPSSTVAFKCSVGGCSASRYVLNPRVGYERYKWQKRRGR